MYKLPLKKLELLSMWCKWLLVHRYKKVADYETDSDNTDFHKGDLLCLELHSMSETVGKI